MATSAGVFSVMSLAGVGLRSTRVVEVRRLRCHAEDQTQEVLTPTVLAKSNTAAPHPPPPPTPPPAPKVSTKFTDVLAFSGPAPERINGRLAMVGFVAALAVEITTGHDVIEQLSYGGLQWFLLASGVLMVASLVPLFRGVMVESVSDGFMSSKAELWNGRMAMLGLVALVFTEYLKGGPFI